MLGLEDFMTIQALVKRGVYLCDIAGAAGGASEDGEPGADAGRPAGTGGAAGGESAGSVSAA